MQNLYPDNPKVFNGVRPSNSAICKACRDHCSKTDNRDCKTRYQVVQLKDYDKSFGRVDSEKGKGLGRDFVYYRTKGNKAKKAVFSHGYLLRVYPYGCS
jgi:hypothetical protein